MRNDAATLQVHAEATEGTMVIKEINGIIHVIDSCFYPVRPKSKVTLGVAVGNFQAGGSTYTWKEQSVTGNPNFQNQPVNGKDERIGGTTLNCMTKVTDIRQETNHTSVTFTLKGGVREQSFPYGVSVLKDNGLAVYQVTFIFPEQSQ
jgi:hypothetical protein